MKVFTLISLIALSVSGQAFAGGSIANQLASSASMTQFSGSTSAGTMISASLNAPALLNAPASAYADKIASDKRAEMRDKVNPARAAGAGSLASSGAACTGNFCSKLLTSVNNPVLVNTPSINVQQINVQQPAVVVKPGPINTNPVVNVGAMKSVAAIR
jgi:hypothetical protein